MERVISSHQKLLNDAAERVIKLTGDYNELLIRPKELVKYYRSRFPNVKKKTLWQALNL